MSKVTDRVTALDGRGSFYVIIGSSASALVGLRFAGMTLIAGRSRRAAFRLQRRLRSEVLPTIPASWRPQVGGEVEKPYFRRLEEFVGRERSEFEVYPAEADTFQALELTPFRKVNVVLLGQDPYPGPNQAHGLCFSVKPKVAIPASLRNIFKELKEDVSGFRVPNNGYLASWARQGILMLNTVLTVRAGQIGSHRGKGWETFTDKIIERVSARKEQVVFVLWGRDAHGKEALVDADRHVILKAAHPSPLSAKHGFFGSRHFSAVNRALGKAGKPEIDWQIPDV